MPPPLGTSSTGSPRFSRRGETPRWRRRRPFSLRHGNPAKTLARRGSIWYGDGHITLDLGVRGGRQCYSTEMEMCPIPAGLLPLVRSCVQMGGGAAA